MSNERVALLAKDWLKKHNFDFSLSDEELNEELDKIIKRADEIAFQHPNRFHNWGLDTEEVGWGIIQDQTHPTSDQDYADYFFVSLFIDWINEKLTKKLKPELGKFFKPDSVL